MFVRRDYNDRLALLFPINAQAHIGSPNVVFDGQAGPNPVRVVIRPPATLPGVARVSVNSEGSEKCVGPDYRRRICQHG